MAVLRRALRWLSRDRRAERFWLAGITAVVVYGWLVVVPDAYRTITVNRTNVTGAICQFENESRQALRVLIVQSTVASKHIHYPGPKYPQRAVRAELYAKTLAPGDCARLQKLVAARAKFKRVPMLTVGPKELAPLHTP